MDPWIIIGWLIVVFIGGGLGTLVIAFFLSLLVEGIRTIRHQQRLDQRAELQLRRHVG